MSDTKKLPDTPYECYLEICIKNGEVPTEEGLGLWTRAYDKLRETRIKDLKTNIAIGAIRLSTIVFVPLITGSIVFGSYYMLYKAVFH